MSSRRRCCIRNHRGLYFRSPRVCRARTRRRTCSADTSARRPGLRSPGSWPPRLARRRRPRAGGPRCHVARSCYAAGMVWGLSEQEIFDEVIVTPRRAFPPLPDLSVIERPGWMQIITPSIKTGSLNEVLFSALDADGADAVIDAAIAEYRGLGLKFRWSVGPGSAPADLGERLARRGLVASWGRGMARPTSAPPQADDPVIRIVEVDATTIDAFSQVN